MCVCVIACECALAISESTSDGGARVAAPLSRVSDYSPFKSGTLPSAIRRCAIFIRRRGRGAEQQRQVDDDDLRWRALFKVTTAAIQFKSLCSLACFDRFQAARLFCFWIVPPCCNTNGLVTSGKGDLAVRFPPEDISGHPDGIIIDAQPTLI